MSVHKPGESKHNTGHTGAKAGTGTKGGRSNRTMRTTVSGEKTPQRDIGVTPTSGNMPAIPGVTVKDAQGT